MEKHIRLGHAGIVDHSVDLEYQIKKKKLKKGMDRAMKKKSIKQIPVPYGSILHIPPTNLLLLAAKQGPYKTVYLLTKNIGRIFWKKCRRMDHKKIRQKE